MSLAYNENQKTTHICYNIIVIRFVVPKFQQIRPSMILYSINVDLLQGFA